MFKCKFHFLRFTIEEILLKSFELLSVCWVSPKAMHRSKAELAPSAHQALTLTTSYPCTLSAEFWWSLASTSPPCSSLLVLPIMPFDLRLHISLPLLASGRPVCQVLETVSPSWRLKYLGLWFFRVSLLRVLLSHSLEQSLGTVMGSQQELSGVSPSNSKKTVS